MTRLPSRLPRGLSRSLFPPSAIQLYVSPKNLCPLLQFPSRPSLINSFPCTDAHRTLKAQAASLRKTQSSTNHLTSTGLFTSLARNHCLPPVVMALRSTSYLNSTWSRLRSHAVAAVPPLNHPRAYATSATAANAGRAEPRKGKPVGQFVPVYAAAGMIALALCIGLHTAKQQLMHAPAVWVKKSKRETVPEVVEPEHVEEESEKFLNRSFFRKVAHVQDFDTSRSPVPDSIRKDVYAHPPKAETLRSVGVDPAPKQA